MDPNEALKNAREALYVFSTVYEGDTGEREAQAEALADAFEALDGWLSKGGFLPDDWRKAQQQKMAEMGAIDTGCPDPNCR